MRTRTAAGLSLIGLFGCLSPNVSTPIHHTATFVEAEYAPYRRPGSATVAGEAFVRAPNGEVRFGSGCTVNLDPVSSYSSEWFDLAVRNRIAIGLDDPRVLEFRRSTQADSQGRFSFENLPAGEYYVTCDIYWTEQRYAGSTTSELFGTFHTRANYETIRVGGTAHAKTKVMDTQAHKVVLAW